MTGYEKENYLHRTWDLKRRKGHLYVLLYEEFASRLGGKNLFLGCNTGSSLQMLRTYGHDVVGLDINKRALDMARSRGCTVVQADATKHIPFKDGHFDTVLALDFIEHIWESDVLDFVAEVTRVMVPGGTLLALSPRTDAVKPSGMAMDPVHVQWYKTAAQFSDPWQGLFDVEEVRHETRSNPGGDQAPHDAWLMVARKK